MINSNFVKNLWKHRHGHIHISRTLFNEKEMEYLCKVLDECNFTNYDFISTRTLCRTVKEGYKTGKDWKTVADELKKSNKIIGEYA